VVKVIQEDAASGMSQVSFELAPFGMTVAARGTLVRLALRASDQCTIDMRPRSLIEQMNEEASAQNGTT
jgi:hypothetical protein